MSNTMRLTIPQAGDLMLAAPRQVWLATLGAAAVAREWAEKEAGTMFRSLVQEGSAVESRAIQRIGAGADAVTRRATRLARSTRSGVTASVATLADAASTFVRAKLPALRSPIAIERPPRKRAAKPAGRTRTAKRSTASRRAAKAKAK